MTKFIFITGGVVSSLGKGIAAAALAAILQARGYSVRIRKLDPYLNVDPGTMNPTQHGEVFVTDDGAETDLDLGHYERFTGIASKKSDNITTGQIYQAILESERQGVYDGQTVQVIPHVTNHIKDFIRNETEDVDFLLAEIGGTVGDIEGLPFFEAIRQMANEEPRGQCAFVHLTLLPYISSAHELKTKPTQHSVKELRSIGIQPDVLLVRSDRPMVDKDREKIALFCNVHPNSVVPALDVSNIYDIPIAYHEAGFDKAVLKALHFDVDNLPSPKLDKWQEVCHRIHHPEGVVKIGVVGKYIGLKDAYKSLTEALHHGGIANNVAVEIVWLDVENVEQGELEPQLSGLHGILVPGGFGKRGSEGKIKAIQYAREKQVPFLGICFGMQMAIIECARNQAQLSGASSAEFGQCDDEVVGLMTEWSEGNEKQKRTKTEKRGGTLRKGSYPAVLSKDSLVSKIYASRSISERHRHRYEVNIAYRDTLEKHGLVFSGLSPDGRLPEIIEQQNHVWFLGVQFHPELKSQPLNPHPIFVAYIAAALTQSRLV